MAKRILALLLCAVMLASCFVGCSKADDGDKGQYITAYLSNDIYDLDPAKAYTNESLTNVVGLLFDTLFKLDSNKKVKKSLVSSYWTTEDDNSQEYIMYLRLNSKACWSDGTAVSANDVVYAWKRLLEVDASYSAAALLFDIKNARAAWPTPPPRRATALLMTSVSRLRKPRLWRFGSRSPSTTISSS